jgi:hypothetical protein
MADAPALSTDVTYYQRVLARDQSEASEILERQIAEGTPDTVYDALLLPALNFAERDRLEEQISADEEAVVVNATRELMQDAEALTRAARAKGEGGADPHVASGPPRREPLAIAAYPASGAPDHLALEMLSALLVDDAISLDIQSPQTLSSEVIARIRTRGYRAVCIADLPPSPPSKTRYLVRKLRAEFPALHIIVGRWAPRELADDNPAELSEAGANHIGTTLLDTRDHLRGLIHLALVEERLRKDPA